MHICSYNTARFLLAAAFLMRPSLSFSLQHGTPSIFGIPFRYEKQSKRKFTLGSRFGQRNSCEVRERNVFRIRSTFQTLRSKQDPSETSFETENNFRFLNSREVKEALRSPVVELGVACLVLLGCLLFALQTLPWEQQTAHRLAFAEDAISWAFVAEYLTRWYSRNFRPSYVLKIEMIIDLLAFLPLLLRAASLTDVKGLTFLRVLRVLRLQRFFLDAESFQLFADSLPRIFGTGFRVKPYQLQVISYRSAVVPPFSHGIRVSQRLAGRTHSVKHLRPPLHHSGSRPHRGARRQPEDPRLLQRLLLCPHHPHHSWLRRHCPGKPPSLLLREPCLRLRLRLPLLRTHAHIASG
jgi:hypothetical protein